MKLNQIFKSSAVIAAGYSLITGLCLIVAIECVDRASAQTQLPPPKVEATPDPLALTDAEKAEGAPLGADLLQKERTLTSLLDAVLLGNQDAILTNAQTARIYFTEQVLPARAKQADWLKRAQDAHGCAGCGLRDGVFVKAEKK